MSEPLDVLIVVPFETIAAGVVNPEFRKTVAGYMMLPLTRAVVELEQFVGHQLNYWQPQNRPVFNGERMAVPAHRSATAVTLATCAERAGLRWAALDPGPQELHDWRRDLQRYVAQRPRVVAISTTFNLSAPWLKGLCALVRKLFPAAKLVIGGYYYTSNSREFLAFDADVLCVGEGEERFPQIVCAIRDGKRLDGIPGLYVRGDDGRLTYTGPVEPLRFAAVERPDWRLAARIQPPAAPDTGGMEVSLETQRGCAFECQFCTFRALVDWSVKPAADAVEAILASALPGDNCIALVDATASAPRKRWLEVLDGLIARGGSPNPIWAFTRVSDVSADVAQRMGRAGIRHVFIGQESGDQRMLDAMHKGTRIAQVQPAIAALAAAGITATFSFIHGYPGETAASIQATRDLICKLNPISGPPVVLDYTLYPFAFLDFAAVTEHPSLAGTTHMIGYRQSEATISGRQAVEAALGTILATSKVPTAPPFLFMLGFNVASSGIYRFTRSNRFAAFRWQKAVEQGVSIFLDHDLNGAAIDLRKLRGVKRAILAGYAPAGPLASARARVQARLFNSYLGRLGKEWTCEAERGIGPLSRASMAALTYRDSGSLRTGLASLRSGTYFGLEGAAAAQAAPVLSLAQELRLEALSRK